MQIYISYINLYLYKRNSMRNIIISKLLNVEIFKIIIKNDEKYTYSHLQIITIKKIIFVFNKLLLHPKLIHYTF